MVHEGWRYGELMEMSYGEFVFWFEEQQAYIKRQNEAANKGG